MKKIGGGTIYRLVGGVKRNNKGCAVPNKAVSNFKLMGVGEGMVFLEPSGV